jgi:tripartite-type tricarboxylate transporter receptor subunit TctC
MFIVVVAMTLRFRLHAAAAPFTHKPCGDLMMKSSRRFLGRTAALLALAILPHASAHAQDIYPSRPIKMIVPLAPGNSADLIARIIADRLGQALGHAVVVDNRPGAAGAIGLTALAGSPADGYTIGMGSIGPLALNPALKDKLPYDPRNGFSMISVVYKGPMLFLVEAASPINNLKEMVQLSLTQPQGLDFASAGAGSVMHLTGEHFSRVTGAKLTHVPSQGTAKAATLLLGKHVPLMIENTTAAMSFVRSGQMRAIAITSPQRLSSLPDVPTTAEAGFPDFVTEGWLVIVAPAAVPAAARDRLAAEIRKIMASADVRAKITDLGGVAEAMTPEQSTTYVHAEAVKWAELIKSVGLKLD